MIVTIKSRPRQFDFNFSKRKKKKIVFDEDSKRSWYEDEKFNSLY